MPIRFHDENKTELQWIRDVEHLKNLNSHKNRLWINAPVFTQYFEYISKHIFPFL